METKRISVAGAKARFSAVIDDVLHGSDRYVIERRGCPVAALVSIEDLERIRANCPTGSQPAGALALVGLWADMNDAAIDTFIRDVYQAREADTGRSVDLST